MRTDAVTVLDKEVLMPTRPNHSYSPSTQADHDCPAVILSEPTQQSQAKNLSPPDDHVRLDFERLDCYQVAVQFTALAARLIPAGHRALRDQLSRAAASVPLNIAESAGRTAPSDKAHFIAIARGSAMECAAVIDVLLASGIAPIGPCRAARRLLVRVAQMLTRLEARLRVPVGR
jgi:four helix bundle protein